MNGTKQNKYFGPSKKTKEKNGLRERRKKTADRKRKSKANRALLFLESMREIKRVTLKSNSLATEGKQRTTVVNARQFTSSRYLRKADQTALI
ncbi:hypothetical protein TNCT_275291 [Trichonephila clavata]|uniref:Uncharacterized protein n=1 Tax=Trichonephila clavata TaxID=2740835 RepID=A0A8X6KI05_TRICU|nr:hypothetical protein TNCT_275291 [Trichonephila clavata]